jgi:endonuclease-3
MHSTRKLAQITSRLRKSKGPCQAPRRWDNPLDCLIHSLLCQDAAGPDCERVYANLRRRYVSLEAVWKAPLKALAAILRPGGLANVKAVRVKALLEEIWKAQGHFDLSFLRDLPDEEVRAYLARITGAGERKTLACALLYGLGRPAFPVDLHVFRVCRRLGLLDGQRTPERAQAFLEPLVAPRDRHLLHVHFADHGRQVCTAHFPACDSCVLATLCDHAQRA